MAKATSEPRSLVVESSLAKTLININDALFNDKPIGRVERAAAANWIVSRHSQPRAYANTFAPTAADYKNGAPLFSGEVLTSGAQTGHILGEEAMRVLLLLGHQTKKVTAALEAATKTLQPWIWNSPSMPGRFCCATCTVALWRNLLAGSFIDHERVMQAGLKRLKRHREGNGRWKNYPFYYTVLALLEMPFAAAQKELQYAAPVCSRIVKRKSPRTRVARIRRELATRALTKC